MLGEHQELGLTCRELIQDNTIYVEDAENFGQHYLRLIKKIRMSCYSKRIHQINHTVTLNTLAHKIPSQSLESLDEFGQLERSTENDNDLVKEEQIINWTYILIEWPGKRIYHLDNKEAEATIAKIRHMKDNTVETLRLIASLGLRPLDTLFSGKVTQK
ncbi:hypothetical protein H5410_028752 [Solanum commersonii]|uniref:Uncharacterized protein n=1 Tax=Solanum commersonii TaxID=4109 RepID=A0A9J5Z717_SOLCO|nr:hypothetical protein H5410_028752 [Solanum commersonii]